jgi:hypothetical protein
MLGTGGCGLEFELEPILKALAPAPDMNGNSGVAWTAPGYIPPIFYNGTWGHGNDPNTNGGFVRPGSMLAIVVLCDEDDGSTDHYEIFGDDPMYSAVALNVRPVAFGSMLFPVQRYIDGLIGLRRRPASLSFTAIVGIPSDLSPPSGTRTTSGLLDRITTDPRMMPMIDPAHTERLVAACRDDVGTQTAAPGLRIAQVAQGLAQHGAHVAIHSICVSDFQPAMEELVDHVARP